MRKIVINLDRHCKRCGKGGATDGGLCLPCILTALESGEFDDVLNAHRQARDSTTVDKALASVLGQPTLSRRQGGAQP
ncbi:MAG: hypothetical protein V2A79_19885 [Planctomycetota bacterium]